MKRRGFPPGVSEFQDRHGKWRVRGRRKGLPSIYFRQQPGTDDFYDEYRRWLAGEIEEPKIGAGREKPGSISALIARYYRSAEYVTLSKATRTTYRGILERFRVEHGDKPAARLERQHVKAIMEKKVSTPSAANNLFRMIRMLMRFAIEEGWRRDDPTIGIKPLRIRSSGFATWTEDDIAAFEAAHPVGTRARLAMALLLYTGQRRSDVVTMGRQHVRRGRIHVVQQKTTARLAIPIHPALEATLDRLPVENMTFLTTAAGKPFTPAGFGNWFREVVDAAGLPAGLAAHGLRKAAARRLAEAGCSTNQIAAVTGHKTLREVARYTAAASQERLADDAMRLLEDRGSEQSETEDLANRGGG